MKPLPNQLPPAISAYIKAVNVQAPERVAACFHAEATVHDEGKARHGREQIEAWARETGTRYRSTIEPVGLDAADNAHALRALVRGNFPGSPIQLSFHFLLRSGAIQSLEIRP